MRETTMKGEKRYARFFFTTANTKTRARTYVRECFSDIMCVLLTRTHRIAASSDGANSLNSLSED